MREFAPRWLFTQLAMPVYFAGVAFALSFLSSVALADPFKAAILIRSSGAEPILSGPSPDSRSVGEVPVDQIFYTEPSESSWLRVQANGNKTGFITGARIRLVKGPLTGGAQSSITPADVDSSAEPEDVEAQFTLGLKFMRGIGVEVDHHRAAYWLGKAASTGHLAAKADMATLLFNGQGVRRDQKLAMSLLEEGLTEGNSRAQFCYAVLLSDKADQTRDLGIKHRFLTESISWLEKAAVAAGEDGARAAGLRKAMIETRTAVRNAAASRLVGALQPGGDSGVQTCSRCGGTGREFTSGGNVSGLSCESCGGSGHVD